MLKNYFKIKLCVFLFTFIFSFGFSQTPNEIKKTTKNYNKSKLFELERSLKNSFNQEYSDAVRLANQNNWPIIYSEGTTVYQIKTVINGKPIYISSDNVDAAISTRTNYLHNGGGLGLDLEGQNMNVHIWEVGGVAPVNHNEFDGVGGTDRVSIGDGTTAIEPHAGHVTGTIVASGLDPLAKGMAPQASAVVYDITNRLAEITNAATNGLLLSNHSYGIPAESLKDDLSWIMGAYTQDSKNLDDIMFNAPYYLYVGSAGNSGNDNTSNSNPLGGNSDYDKLSSEKTSKNSLIIANGQDATINPDGTLNSVLRNPSSSEGPTDDLRIKPDIMGNGTGVYSSTVVSTGRFTIHEYATFSGTSMSAPNVCGSLLLLQQHHNNINGSFMKAATLKGLALHTADDVNGLGPDANTGWGLLNTKLAAETITDNGFSSLVSEETLVEGESFSIDVVSDGTNPLLASISWTDRGGQLNPTGAVNDGIIYFNDDTPALVNDLDIRVTQTSNTYTPWKLTGVDTNAQGDNFVDPYERVDISGAAGTYTITVTHKGSLVGGSQDFSLIVTGVTSNFNFNTATSEQTICTPSNASYTFDYLETGGAATNFSLLNVPAGASTNISPNSLNANGSFDVTFSNLTNVLADTYEISVIGNDGSETKSKKIKLRVLKPDFANYPQALSSPNNGATGMPNSLTLSWSENTNAESYLVQVSTNPSFSSIDFSSTETDLDFELTGLNSETVYYWRVRPDNNCSNGDFSQIYSFQVGALNCGNVYSASDFSDANILTTAGDLASVPVTVSTGGSIINSIETSFEINHTWVNDINITLEGPNSIGNTQVLLFDSSCTTDTGGSSTNPGDGDNFNVTYSDLGSPLFCDDINVPSISGTILPIESLSAYSGLAADGVWTLRISDPNNGDGGDIIAFSINVCTVDDIASIPTLVNNGFNAPLNATYTFSSSDIEATSDSETATQQIYTIVELPNIGTLEKNAVPLNVGDSFTQDDINTAKISYKNIQTAAYNDSFKVDIKNAANGWLANQIVSMDNALSLKELNTYNVNIWPNPTNENINVQLENLISNNDVSISLYDIRGRIIKNYKYEVNATSLTKSIEVNDVINGVYLLEIKQGNKKTTHKIIINN